MCPLVPLCLVLRSLLLGTCVKAAASPKVPATHKSKHTHIHTYTQRERDTERGFVEPSPPEDTITAYLEHGTSGSNAAGLLLRQFWCAVLTNTGETANSRLPIAGLRSYFNA
ncbi:hypothetical protein chiPu_0020612 [Chiloscyllium punctatum]|uniref:Secreted protein n=1 Tax=Chiloscyllium punctatum TaxID=137246 RepID=A0A401RHI6_CHIPU|nr:hypothetical protein [Chiloscyllium punctatum]